MRSNSWTTDEEEWFRAVYPTHYCDEIIRMHSERFPDLPERTAKAINSRAKKLGLHKAVPRRPKRMWTDEKAEWFMAFVPGHTESEISAEHERLYGFPLTEAQIGNAKSNLGVRSGTTGGRFPKGHVPANKGKTWDEYGTPEGHERSRRAHFKKGEVSRRDGWIKPVGYERVDRDGYTMVKVKDGLQGEANENYRMKHHVVWEEHNGPIPPRTQIVFADHDRRNFDPDNLVAVPRELWAVIRQQRMRYSDRESLEACMNLARLRRTVFKAKRPPRECRRCGSTFSPRYPRQRTCDSCLGRDHEKG